MGRENALPAGPPPERGGRGDGQGHSWASIVVPVRPEGMGGLECLEGGLVIGEARSTGLWALIVGVGCFGEG